MPDEHPCWTWVQASLHPLDWTIGTLAAKPTWNTRTFTGGAGDGPSVDLARIVAQAFTRANPHTPVTLLDALTADEVTGELKTPAEIAAYAAELWTSL